MSLFEKLKSELYEGCEVVYDKRSTYFAKNIIISKSSITADIFNTDQMKISSRHVIWSKEYPNFTMFEVKIPIIDLDEDDDQCI